jgi:hypothetical protein
MTPHSEFSTHAREQSEKSGVPDTFQLGAIFEVLAFLASHKINKFRVFNTPEYSNSPASTNLKLL